MGGFINNIQIQARGVDASVARQRIVDAVRAAASREGLTEADAEDADREIVIASSGDWWTLFDEAHDAQDVKELQASALALSAATGFPCVTLLVHDGEKLNARLFVDGKRSSGWSALVEDEAAVRAALSNPFGDDAIEHLAPLLGWNIEHAMRSYRYVDELPRVELIRLRFVSATPAPHRRRVSGPPAFAEPRARSAALMLAVEERGELSVTATSAGGSDEQGFDVMLFGDAIDEGILDPTAIAASRYVAGAERIDGEWQAVAQDGRQYRIARFAQLRMPAAVAPLPPDVKPSHVLRWSEAHRATRFAIDITLRGAKRGYAKLIYAVRPIANRAGAAANTIDVVCGEARRPRTSHLPPNAPPLRALELKHQLHAQIALRRDTPPEAIYAACIAWHEALITTLGDMRGAYGIDHWKGAKVTRGGLAAEDFAQNGFLRARLRDFDNQHLVYGMFLRDRDESLADSIGFHADTANRGFEVTTQIAGVRRPKPTETTIRLILWRTIRDVAPERSAPLEGVLTTIVDELATAGGLLQAFLARWAAFDDRLTPYEQACGLVDPAKEKRGAFASMSKEVRGVSDRMWLGPELLSRIDRGALERVATVTPLGDSLRIDRRDDATLDDLEEALDPILPRA